MSDRFPVEDFLHVNTDGFEAFIVIHKRPVGKPAVGGCRIREYPITGEAFRDARLLARAMSYKHAIVGTGYGGGKMVVNASAPRFKDLSSVEVAERIGKAVNMLDGQFITAGDMGVDHHLLRLISHVTPHVAQGAHTASWTALGVSKCAALVWDRIKDPVVSHSKAPIALIEGYGSVGRHLANTLHRGLGWRVAVADPLLDTALGAPLPDWAVHVPMARLHDVWCDVFMPCGPGGTIDATVGHIPRAKVICGAANNPIANASTSFYLKNSGIVYVPDFIANSGGLIAAVGGPWAHALPSGRYYGDADIRTGIEGIEVALEAINSMARKNGNTLEFEAVREAEARIAKWPSFG